MVLHAERRNLHVPFSVHRDQHLTCKRLSGIADIEKTGVTHTTSLSIDLTVACNYAVWILQVCLLQPDATEGTS